MLKDIVPGQTVIQYYKTPENFSVVLTEVTSTWRSHLII